MTDIDEPELDLVTLDFVDQVLYHTAVREALIGIEPTSSEIVQEIREFRWAMIGQKYLDWKRRSSTVIDMVALIKENHARVKELSVMLEEDRDDKEEIEEYIRELYLDSEQALMFIEELNGQ